MLKELKELLLIIFSQDNDNIDTIKTSMGEEVAEQYPAIPDEENIDKMLKEIESSDRVEVVDVGILDDEEAYGNITFPKYSNWIMFKISDVKIKRRKIFRLGDYYVKLFHSGLNKWNFMFFTKSRMMMGPDTENNYTFTDYYYPAQHPHIYSGKPCLGGFDVPLRASLTNYNLTSFMWNLELYLDNWNYRSPHHQPEVFEYTDCEMIENEHFIPILLRNMYIGDYLDSLNIDSYRDVYNHHSFKLTSARCKEYETEPTSRIVMEQYFWNKNSDPRVPKNFLYNIERYIRTKYVENNIQFEHRHDSIVFIKHLYNMLWKISKHQLMSNSYIWNDNNENMLNDIRTCQNYLSYYINRRVERDYSDSYLYYLQRDKEQPQEIRDKCIRLSRIYNQLEDIKSESYSSHPPGYKIREGVYTLFANIFQNDNCFKDKESILILINNIELEATKNITNQKIDDLYEEFIGLQSILKLSMNNWIIDYHKTELRRLNDGRTDINIENLNL